MTLPEIPDNVTITGIGAVIFFLGIVMVIGGLGLVELEKIKVTKGRTTWIVGFVFMIIGLMPFILGNPKTADTPTPVPTQTSIVVNPSLLTSTPTDQVFISPIPSATESSTMALISQTGNGLKDCIDSSIWQAYTQTNVEVTENCLNLSNWGIDHQTNGLTLNMEGRTEELRQGIYMPVTSPVIITLSATISQLYTPFENNLANLSFGVIPINPLDLSLMGQLFLQQESPEEGYPIFIKLQERGGFAQYLQQDGHYINIEEAATHLFSFILQNQELTILIDNVEVQKEHLPYETMGFWIGYRLPAGGALNAFVSNVSVEWK